MVFSTSGITLTSPTEIPRELSQVANVLVFKSFVLPDNTSLPIMIIAADISFLLVISKYKLNSMKFTNTLLKGKLQRRYKRFFADIEVNNKTVVAHCPNTGSMMGLLDQGNEAWVSEHNDPKRKLKFTLDMIKVK